MLQQVAEFGIDTGISNYLSTNIVEYSSQNEVN